MPQSKETHIDAFLLTAVGRWAEDKSTELHDNAAAETARQKRTGASPRANAESSWVLPNLDIRSGRYEKEPRKQARQNRNSGLQYQAASPTRLAKDHSLAMQEVQFWHPALEKTKARPRPRTRQQGDDYVLGTYSRDKRDKRDTIESKRVLTPATQGKR
ncbi:hypothetical protein F5X99DRAFT_289091 [Biscogniauxia marginata]|nr:hypothetical protein F5X99DRAFT_289091 [Biscogniauxia marginata]